MNTDERLKRLRKVILSKDLDGMLVSAESNVSYISGFTGDSSLLVVTSAKQYFITDFRYVEQAASECPGWTVVRRGKDGLWKTAAAAMAEGGVRKLGFESGHLTHAGHAKLAEAAEGVTLTPLADVVETLRAVKTPEEIERIEEALRTQESALREVLAWIRPGITEKRVAAELDCRMRLGGAERPAFETIVATAERASLPHARPTERVISQGDAVLVDWGATCFFYNSDLTRVVHFGTVSREFRAVYDIVRSAQERALAVIRPGVTFSEVDGAARGFIAERGHGESFGHALGHGVGLEVHESPVVREGNTERLQPGMVFTVEPGIYIPGWGGVRIEDMVLVTDDGVRVLSDFERDLDKLTL